VSPQTLLVVLSSVLLNGCVPVESKYERIDASGAKYFRSECYGGSGPPSIVYYPYHGIFISLDITSWIALGIHLPAGMTAQLDDTTTPISGVTDTGPTEVTLPIRAADQGSLGSATPREFYAIRTPFSSPNNFGPFTGATKDGRYAWYLFLSETDREPARLISTPPGLVRGTVELPAMTINGERHERQTLHFERQIFRGIMSVNC
jgi:hypothetical protein